MISAVACLISYELMADTSYPYVHQDNEKTPSNSEKEAIVSLERSWHVTKN